MAGANTAESAGKIASRAWLRPGVSEEAKAREAASRGTLADQLAAPAPAGPYTRSATQDTAGSAGAGGGTVKVEIEHKNAPEGTKTKVETKGNVQASSRIARSGVGAIA